MRKWKIIMNKFNYEKAGVNVVKIRDGNPTNFWADLATYENLPLTIFPHY